MKRFALALTLIAAQVASASGNFYCTDSSRQYSIRAVTSRLVGSPIAQDVEIKAGSKSFSVPVERIAQYKQNDATLYALGLDEELQFAAFELETYANKKSGVLMGRLTVRYLEKGKRIEAWKSVVCEVE